MTRDELRPLLLHEGPFLFGPNGIYPFSWERVHGGAIALLLKCPGDGRHWINETSSAARALRHCEAGEQVLGLVAADRVKEVKAMLGEYPHCGDSVCERCAGRPAISDPDRRRALDLGERLARGWRGRG